MLTTIAIVAVVICLLNDAPEYIFWIVIAWLILSPTTSKKKEEPDRKPKVEMRVEVESKKPDVQVTQKPEPKPEPKREPKSEPKSEPTTNNTLEQRQKAWESKNKGKW